MKSSVPSKRSPAENARIGLLGRALQVGALSVAIAALIGMVLAAALPRSGNLWRCYDPSVLVLMAESSHSARIAYSPSNKR